MYHDEPTTAVLSVRLPLSVDERLTALARSARRSKAEIVRTLITRAQPADVELYPRRGEGERTGRGA